MRVLVTGASGFVGSALVARLHGDGHTVVAVSRRPDQTQTRLGVDQAVSWDGLDQAFSRGIDAVVHLAGETVQGRWNMAKVAAVRTSRIETTQAIIDAIARAERTPLVLLSASGIGYYGCGGEVELTESSPAGEDYFAALCVDWEGIALEAERVDCRVCLLRLGMVLGAGGGAISAIIGPAKWGVSGPLGSGQQWWSWIGITDAVSAMVFALNSDMSGPVNLVSPSPIRQAEFQRVLGRVVHRPAFLPAPAFVLRWLLGTFAEEVLSSKRVMPAALQAAGFEWDVSDLQAALSDSV